jgi:hypothetical protein
VAFRVTITPQDEDGEVSGAAITLCDSPESLAVHDIRINGRAVLDVVQFLDALYPRVFNRGNRALTVQFSTNRNKGIDGQQFTSPGQAFAFAFDQCAFAELLPHYGFVTIEADGVVRYLDGCGLAQIGMDRIKGIGLWFTYQLIGGTPLSTAPVEE